MRTRRIFVVAVAAVALLTCSSCAYELCGAGNVFRHVNCDNYPNARDITSGKANGGGGCRNVISCNPGGPELYSINVDTQYGYDDQDKSVYYARGTASPVRGGGRSYTYCWKREGAHGDGCACLCEAIRQHQGDSGPFRSRPECECKFI